MFDEGSWWEPPPHSLFNEMPPQLYYTAYKPKAKGDFYVRFPEKFVVISRINVLEKETLDGNGEGKISI